jgi:2-aminoadipate transaminase
MSNVVPVAEGEFALAGWTRSIKRSVLQEMLAATARPDIISFALGLPAVELFHIDAYARAAAHVLAADPRAMQYGPPFRPLKRQVVELMARRGVACVEEQVFLTAGAQQGLSLLARLLLDARGQVLTEEMTYTGFQQVIEPFQPEILTVPTDLDTGIDVDAVESLLAGGARPAFIYTVSSGHNPLGVTISAEKRQRLVSVARRYGVPILEDDPYGFLSYGEAPAPPLRAHDDRWVFYVGSFSKILAPALRVGWIVAPEELIPYLSIIKESSDIDTSTYSQRVVSRYLEEGHLSDHLKVLRREYGSRRDTMLGALREYFQGGARWNTPTSGVFIWVELRGEVDTWGLLREAIARERVAFIPGGAFYVGGGRGPTNCMRLNFSHTPAEHIRDGIARLARALKSAPAPEPAH